MATAPKGLNETVRIVLPLAILAVGVGFFFALGSRKPPASRESGGGQAPLVETVSITPHDGGTVIKTDGVVVPYREISLSAEVAGRITDKSPDCRAGRYVTKDTWLVTIDPSRYQLEVQRLTEEVRQAEASLREADVEAENTKSLIELARQQESLQGKELARMQQLRLSRTASEAELEQAQRGLLTARNALVTLENQLQLLQTRRTRLQHAQQLAEARLDVARLDLARTEVRSPIDGVIVTDRVEKDSYVQPGAPLATIEDTAAVEVRCNLQMEELRLLWQNAEQPVAAVGEVGSGGDYYQVPRARATIEYRLGGQEYVWDGVLNRYEGIGLDEKTRTVPCRVLVPNPRDVSNAGNPGGRVSIGPSDGAPKALVRGMYVSVRLHTGSSAQLLRVPERAVRPGSTVWRVRDGKLEILTVPAAQILSDSMLVRADASGLRAGDQIVVSPLTAPQEGMPVRVEQSPATREEAPAS